VFWYSISETRSDPTNWRSVVVDSCTSYTSNILMSNPIHAVTACSLFWTRKVSFRTTDLHTVERFTTRNTNSCGTENIFVPEFLSWPCKANDYIFLFSVCFLQTSDCEIPFLVTPAVLCFKLHLFTRYSTASSYDFHR